MRRDPFAVGVQYLIKALLSMVCGSGIGLKAVIFARLFCKYGSRVGFTRTKVREMVDYTV